MDPRTGLPVVGMVGAGQLARMTHQAAIALGQSLRILAADPDDGAALVAADVQIGQHTAYADLASFAEGCDVVTWDHEHVPEEHIRALAAAGHTVLPGADALRHAQDKQVMRERLGAAGLPIPRWAPVSDVDDVIAFADGRWPVVLKAARGGYDGRGVWMLDSAETARSVVASTRTAAEPVPLIVEDAVPLVRELAALVARSPFGQVACWQVVETVQQDGICVEVLAPAPGLDEETAVAAERLAITVATELDVVGVLAVELFEVAGPPGVDRLMVNELAMRPHNSGHWTIEGSRTSQFEQHLRAVLDYPLGVTTATAPVTVMANVLGGAPGGPRIDERVHHLMAHWPDVKIHLYGKAVRPGRKIGHVTALGSELDEVRGRAAAAARYLSDGILPDDLAHAGDAAGLVEGVHR